MFTGIIETTGTVTAVTEDKQNRHFEITSPISRELKVDQSVAHDGTCLTVVGHTDKWHKVTAIKETLDKTTLGSWKVGTLVNLERCMLNNGRFDGHIVQGHVDMVGRVKEIKGMAGSWLFTITFEETSHVVVEKGSITVNGISLTCFDVSEKGFSIAIIPYTWEHTNLQHLKPGDLVNLEFDVIGKYVARLLGK
ncbi:MAG: riboflavin synthase [Cyclobacteriaceae bacterium]|nr:riboflavin synthase [Cyclobacteriaceae bacterium]